MTKSLIKQAEKIGITRCELEDAARYLCELRQSPADDDTLEAMRLEIVRFKQVELAVNQLG